MTTVVRQNQDIRSWEQLADGVVFHRQHQYWQKLNAGFIVSVIRNGGSWVANGEAIPYDPAWNITSADVVSDLFEEYNQDTSVSTPSFWSDAKPLLIVAIISFVVIVGILAVVLLGISHPISTRA